METPRSQQEVDGAGVEPRKSQCGTEEGLITSLVAHTSCLTFHFLSIFRSLSTAVVA